MQTRSVIAGLAIASTATLALALPAQAAPKPSNVITVIGSNATLGIDDLSAKGPTPGDIRTLSLDLKNLKDQPAGRVDVVQTLTRQDGAIGTAVKQVVLSLPRGTITGLGQAQFTDITDPKARPNDTTEQIAVIGGTGAYIGAKGTIDIVVLPNFSSRWVISLY